MLWGIQNRNFVNWLLSVMKGRVKSCGAWFAQEDVLSLLLVTCLDGSKQYCPEIAFL